MLWCTEACLVLELTPVPWSLFCLASISTVKERSHILQRCSSSNISEQTPSASSSHFRAWAASCLCWRVGCRTGLIGTLLNCGCLALTGQWQACCGETSGRCQGQSSPSREECVGSLQYPAQAAPGHDTHSPFCHLTALTFTICLALGLSNTFSTSAASHPCDSDGGSWQGSWHFYLVGDRWPSGSLAHGLQGAPPCPLPS